jgi:hypothetical protein
MAKSIKPSIKKIQNRFEVNVDGGVETFETHDAAMRFIKSFKKIKNDKYSARRDDF